MSVSCSQFHSIHSMYRHLGVSMMSGGCTIGSRPVAAGVTAKLAELYVAECPYWRVAVCLSLPPGAKGLLQGGVGARVSCRRVPPAAVMSMPAFHQPSSNPIARL
jgi:hypothetical protein